MKPRLRILLTNNELATRAGSEMFLYDVALGLLRRGHNPIAYSLKLGELAEDLERKTVPVIDDLNSLQEPPDVIHGQHHLEAMTAMLRFPRTPAIYYCHGWLPWQERPPVFPTITNYVAVDDLCRERLLTTQGISPGQIRTMYNFVDLRRFQQRSPLPQKPQSALIFSNLASNQNYADIIRSACRRMGIEQVGIMGSNSGNSQSQPEKVLTHYDIVFAKARCALEAMSVGCAVVVTESQGVGGLVTSENVEELRRLNFGIRTMQAAPLSEASLSEALSNYSPDDATKVSNWIRAEADLEKYLDDLEALYLEANNRATTDYFPAEAHLTAASNYIRSLTPLIKQYANIEYRANHFEQQTLMLKNRIQELQDNPPESTSVDNSISEISAVKSDSIFHQVKNLFTRWKTR
ncbi:MAG TPA: hypothetical protein DD473_18160 [Planctomycetaceae bacterium]|nr:hypothetical protein [Planctomycetaceae bacterium]